MAFIGSCTDMCPAAERQTRLGSGVSIFEKDTQNQPNEFAMVKEYRRSGADQEEPSSDDLRTPKALKNTMDHLIFNVMDDSRSKVSKLVLVWYDFLWDRLRAIRKDITQQNICDNASAILVEQCARFHVHCCYAMNQVKDFDVDMNKRNLNDCLQMLRQMYTDLKTRTGTICSREIEFQKYDILLHLDDDHSSSNVLMKTSEHRTSEEMKFIIKVFNAFTINDYFRFFDLMRQADYMTSCLLSLYANKMRLNGLKTIIAACNSRQCTMYPVELAINSLGFNDLDDLREFASSLSIEIQEKDNNAHLVFVKDLVTTLRGSALLAFKSKRLVEDKMENQSLGQLVYGRQSEDEDHSGEPNNYEELNNQDELIDFEEMPPSRYEEQIRYEDINHYEDRNRYEEVDCYKQPGHKEKPILLEELNRYDEVNQYEERKPYEDPNRHDIKEPLRLERLSEDEAPPVETSHLNETLQTESVTEDEDRVEDRVEDVRAELDTVPDNCNIETLTEPEITERPMLSNRPLKRKPPVDFPAGKFKIRKLSSRVPTLRMPPSPPKPPSRCLKSTKHRDTIELLKKQIKEELRANEVFAQLVGMYSN